MSRKNRNNHNNRPTTARTTAPVVAPTESVKMAEQEPSSETQQANAATQVVEDTETAPDQTAEVEKTDEPTQEATAAAPAVDNTPPTPEVQAAPEVVEEVPAVVEVTKSKAVVDLETKLAELKDLLKGRGKKAADFAPAAAKNLEVVRAVLRNCSNEILEAYLAFFVENINGVCRNEEFMKGSTFLSSNDERIVGFVYNLFYEMATGKFGRIENGVVIQVLQRPEIVTFYDRKKAAARRA